MYGDTKVLSVTDFNGFPFFYYFNSKNTSKSPKFPHFEYLLGGNKI